MTSYLKQHAAHTMVPAYPIPGICYRPHIHTCVTETLHFDHGTCTQTQGMLNTKPFKHLNKLTYHWPDVFYLILFA